MICRMTAPWHFYPAKGMLLWSNSNSVTSFCATTKEERNLSSGYVFRELYFQVEQSLNKPRRHCTENKLHWQHDTGLQQEAASSLGWSFQRAAGSSGAQRGSVTQQQLTPGAPPARFSRNTKIEKRSLEGPPVLRSCCTAIIHYRNTLLLRK